MNIKLKFFSLSILISLSSVSFALDTDHDGLPDDWEIENGRDPLVADYMVSLGLFHACALDDAPPSNRYDNVSCWGEDSHGETMPPKLSNPTQITAGAFHTCVIHDPDVVYEPENGVYSGAVVCWGRHPEPEPTLANPTQLSAGGNDTCAIDDTGVVCWGAKGLLAAKRRVPALSNPTQVSAGGDHTCAIDDTGVVCWGANYYGQTTVPALSNPTQVSAGGDHTCALDDTGAVCWGLNAEKNSSPWNVPALINPTQVSAGFIHSCALDDTGVVCWPDNLGIDEPGPLANPSQVSAGNWNSCALNDTGVVCWGDNLYGETAVPNLLIDPDGDGYSNQGGVDAFPLDATEWFDTDFDGIGNNTDDDDDGDGVLDSNDDLPLDPTNDSDDDGVVNNMDPWPNNTLYSIDSDSDGMPDAWETRYGLNPNDHSDATSDQDNDGVTALDEFLAGTIPSGSIDLDGNDQYDALTDGLLLLRGMFGLDGSALVTGTIASDAAYTDSVDIESRIATLGDLADIDGNGEIDALTDGLLTLRYLFGLQGDTLINGVVASDATRQTAEEIEAHLETLMPAF